MPGSSVVPAPSAERSTGERCVDEAREATTRESGLHGRVHAVLRPAPALLADGERVLAYTAGTTLVRSVIRTTALVSCARVRLARFVMPLPPRGWERLTAQWVIDASSAWKHTPTGELLVNASKSRLDPGVTGV